MQFITEVQERFNLKKLNYVAGKEQFCIEVSKRVAAF
jgi:hypothetical protein